MALNAADLRIESWPPTPTRGMLVGMPKGVQITHKPTGISTVCDSERSQHLNRDKALEQLAPVVAAFEKAATQPTGRKD